MEMLANSTGRGLHARAGVSGWPRSWVGIPSAVGAGKGWESACWLGAMQKGKDKKAGEAQGELSESKIGRNTKEVWVKWQLCKNQETQSWILNTCQRWEYVACQDRLLPGSGFSVTPGWWYKHKACAVPGLPIPSAGPRWAPPPHTSQAPMLVASPCLLVALGGLGWRGGVVSVRAGKRGCSWFAVEHHCTQRGLLPCWKDRAGS